MTEQRHVSLPFVEKVVDIKRRAMKHLTASEMESAGERIDGRCM
ncbi:MAG: hypothetical protein ACP5M0_15500 [Desulfomonilaceae bacterium]